jgi:hypothetical protein
VALKFLLLPLSLYLSYKHTHTHNDTFIAEGFKHQNKLEKLYAEEGLETY